MTDENRPGYYRDAEGQWQGDRRKSDRRKNVVMHHQDRRMGGRRKSDMEFQERDAKEQIADALSEFSDPHSDLAEGE